ncbi:MAG TPA: LD-carboxypeptidase [Terriglobales bacterium]|nr:LD-carboxypeptidase [Terriglobales bacterium]
MSNAQRPRIKPPALRRGDRVGIVAPASNIKRELLEAGCDSLRAAGYEPFCLPSILDRDLYFAGSVERRTRELEEMFVREDVRAIVCARGGYGANYLLNAVDIRKIAAHPKIFVGYSDLTTLLTWFTDKAGFVTFHGPMVAKDFALTDGVDFASLRNALEGSGSWQVENSGAKPLIEGEAEGILYGGCLSLLVAALGTPYDIQTTGTILFLEDVAAKPFQIDRMLMQLKLACKLDDVCGLVFGEMMDCHQGNDQDYTLEEVVLRVVGDLGIPVAFGMRSGHTSRANITLPFGVHAKLEVEREVRLQILEPATTSWRIQSTSI